MLTFLHLPHKCSWSHCQTLAPEVSARLIRQRVFHVVADVFTNSLV